MTDCLPRLPLRLLKHLRSAHAEAAELLALLLGGGSIAAIVTTLVVIVGVAVGLLYVAFWILMWILDNWSGGAMVI